MKDKLGVALVKRLCVICVEAFDAEIIMNEVLTEKNAQSVEKMHQQVVGFLDEPCENCQKTLEKAFLIIGFDKEKSDMEDLPAGFYRTGHQIGVKKDSDFVQKFIKPFDFNGYNRGYTFLSIEIMQELGLVREEAEI